MNVINDPSRNSLARALGTGLGKSLERLAEDKYRQLHERQQIKKATDTGAYSPEVASFIQSLPEKNRWEAYQALAQEPQTTPQQYAQAGVPEQMSGLQEFQQQMQPNTQGIAQALQQQFGQPQQQFGGGTQAPQMQQLEQQQPQSFAQRIKGAGGPQQARNQALIDRSNSNWLKGQTKGYEVAERSANILDQMEDLLNTGKVASGIKGNYFPSVFQNTETQLFDKLSNELAGLLAQNYGIPTGMKIKFAQSQKPNLEQNSKTQRELIKRLRKETERPLLMNEIKDQLLAENGYQQPAGLESRVNQLYKQYRDNPESLQGRERSAGRSPEEGTQEIQAHGDESPVGYLGRTATRLAARSGETVAGGLGDIASAGLGVGNYLTGGAIPTYSEVQQYLPISAPTSQQIKDTLSKITNGYTDPQSGFDEILDGVISTAAALVGPGKGKLLAGKLAAKATPGVAKGIQTAAKVAFPLSGTDSWQRALKMGAAGEIGSGIVSQLGGGPIAQSIGKIGLMTAYGIRGTRQALTDTMKAEYNAAENALGKVILPGENTVKASPLLESVEKLKSNPSIKAGPDKDIVNQIITDVEKSLEEASHGATPKIYGAEELLKRQDVVPIKNLWDIKKKLNDWVELGYAPRVPGEKYLPSSARPEVENLNRLVSNQLAKYGEKHPGFGKPYALGEELWKGLNVHDKATKFLKEHIATDAGVKSHLASAGILGALSWILGHPGVAAVGTAGAIAGKEAILLYQLIDKSPKAKQVYLNLIKNLFNENKNAATRDIAALDKELTRYKKTEH